MDALGEPQGVLVLGGTSEIALATVLSCRAPDFDVSCWQAVPRRGSTLRSIG